MIRFIGDNLFDAIARGQGTRAIATAIPSQEMLITIPGIHAQQRLAYIEELNRLRANTGKPPLTPDEEDAAQLDAVDLILDSSVVLIRPDPNRMDLAFKADAMLQEILPKRNVRFLFVTDSKVRDPINHRGEAWRIHPLPRSQDEMEQHIGSSLVGVGGRAIYYYNAARGGRWLTSAKFASLAGFSDDELRDLLCEIVELSGRRNSQFVPELELFMTGNRFTAASIARFPWGQLSPEEMRAAHAQLAQQFRDAVPEDLREDDLKNATWRKRMYAALIGHRGDVLSETDLLGLASEFFMQIEWLPGARVENGELLFDSEMDRDGVCSDDERIVRCLICNVVQESGNLEFINIGRIQTSMSQRQPGRGRREVYVAHFRLVGDLSDQLQIIRLQKWGVAEHLDQGKSLLESIYESEEYTDFILDRRLGCLQLGMNLPRSISVRKFGERYEGTQDAVRGKTIWTTYYQRPYVPGLASDKIPVTRLRNSDYARALATLLGAAAAPNLIVGRTDANGRVIFDDGDEMVLETAGLPSLIVVSDHTGTFTDYHDTYDAMAPAYADAVNSRIRLVPDPKAFAERYLAALEKRFVQIQAEYRARRRGFETLFMHRVVDPAGNFAYRWKKVLSRLDYTNATDLIAMISKHIKL